MQIHKTRILIIDDDPGLRALLERYFKEQDFEVQGAANAAEMDERLEGFKPDVAILDLMLPGEDGLSIARRLREGGHGFGIIMLSARGEDVDRIVGLEVGADDYLPKPFNPRELLARVRAILRRGTPEPETPAREVIRFGPFQLRLDVPVCTRGDEPVKLTRGEYTLLKVLAEHPNRTLSRDTLIDLLKGYERHPYDRSIDVRVTRLRRKIEADPSQPLYLRTVWGEGYLFTPDGQAL